MMRPRWIPITALLLFALLLSGCINIQQEYWLYEDGSARVGMDVGMSEALLSMGSASGSDSTTNPLEDLKNEYNDKNPNIKNVKVREYSDNDLKHFEVTFDVIDFNKFLAAESAQSSEFNISLTRTPDDNILFKQITRLDMGSEAGSLDMESMGSIFKDMYWSVIVHVPQVISTNGERVDNSTVQWKIPMADIFSGKAPDELTMVYEPRGTIGGGGIFGGTGSAGSNWWLWLVVGTVLLAAAVGAAYYFLVYRKRTAPASAAFGGLPPEAGYPPQWGAQPQPGVPLQAGNLPPQWDAQPQPGYPGATPQQPLPAPAGQTPPAYPPPQGGASQAPEYPPYPQYTQAPQHPPGAVQGSDYYPTYPPQPPSAPPPVEPSTHLPDQD